VRSRLAVVGVYGVITVALVAGTTAFITLDKHVSISVDGNVTHVRTYASSVDAVLNRAGVAVGPHDVLTPAASVRVHDGSTITIRRGRPVVLTTDGVTRQVWVTASDVEQALQQAGVEDRGIVVSADRSTRVPLTGISLRVDTMHAVDVHVDGVVHSVVSAQSTVGGVLDEAGITVSATDEISTPLDTRPVDGMVVFIVRLSSGQQLETAAIPFTTSTVADPGSLVGTKRVVQAGRNGTLARTYQLAFADGVQTAKTLASEQVSVPAVPQIIAIGTKPKPKPKPVVVKPVPAPAADGLNWAALARCESGGRPNAVRAPFYGMYQFRVSTWQAVGGSGLPSNASASEQTYRAQLLYKRSNWRTQWPVCGRYLFT
jgi:uncharacterized protein YabE (DUF348 family)